MRLAYIADWISFPVPSLNSLTIFSPFIIREEMVARARDKVFTESLESLLPVALLPLLLQVLLFLDPGIILAAACLPIIIGRS